jgi:glutathione S-transferase
MLVLYDYELSGNCYKVRQLLHWLGVPYQRRAVDFHPGREHKSEWFLRDVNPLGQLPVIDDGGFKLRDAQAILVYLAARYDRAHAWFPEDARTRGEIVLWLAVADDITKSASAARLHDALGYELDVGAARSQARDVFRHLDDHLAARQAAGLRWLAGERVTLADLACFPYVELAPEGGIAMDEFPHAQEWLGDFRRLRGFVPMSGMVPPGPGQAHSLSLEKP